MVLSRTSRTALLCLLALAASACLQKRDTIKLNEPAGVATAFVVAFPDRPEVTTAPDVVVTEVTEALGRRNLQVQPVELSDDFARKRATRDRLQLLAGQSESPFVLLVETTASYYSFINGRYRWDVDLKVTMAPREQLDEARSESYELAAFLEFDHQDHVEALEYSARTIAERTARVVDQFLTGLEAGALAPTAARAPPVPAKVRVPHPLAPGAVIYFAMIDRFANGDPSNDDQIDRDDPQAFHGGDLQGLTDHLDWLDELGVTTVWLSPVFEMRDEKFHGHGAFHGYWVEDFGEIDDRLGGEPALIELSDAARSRGIGLMLDVVLNHVSFDAPLVTEKPAWFHGRGPITDWSDREQLETHDVHGLPDLAHERADVREHLLRHSLRWIDVVQPVGFRLDAVKHIPVSFWTDYNAAVKRHAGEDFVLLGEDLDGDPLRVARTMREGRFDAMFDFPLHFAMVDVFCRDAHPGRLASVLFADRFYGDAVGARREGLVTLLDNHDLPRILSACGNDDDRVIDALIFMLTARGTPSFTWGTESGALGAAEPDNRPDMKFTSHPVGDAMRRWLDLRRRHDVFTHGSDHLEQLGEGSFVYYRTHDTGSAAIVYGAGPRMGPRWELLGSGRRVRVYVTDEVLELGRDGDTTVEFRVSGAPDGEVRIVGSGPELGDWDPAKAPTAGPIELPHGGAFAYKVVVVDGDRVVWQEGENRYLLAEGGAVEIPW